MSLTRVILVMNLLKELIYLHIRTADINDLNAVAQVEAACFPPAEAATREEFAARLTHYPKHFWLLFDGDELIAFADGMVTDAADLEDAMYADASMHNANGAWQMIFGLNTLPEYRKRGCAGQLIRRIIDDAREQGRSGVVLTCKEHLLKYYASFGFIDEGISAKSTHGGAVWHQMRIRL